MAPADWSRLHQQPMRLHCSTFMVHCSL